MTSNERAELVQRVATLQQPDGGWNLASFDKLERSDHSAQPTASDGYATALVALALEANTLGRGRKDACLERGLLWLNQNQAKDGQWQAYSLNKQRDAESNIGKFMSDTATGFAVLALQQSANR